MQTSRGSSCQIQGKITKKKSIWLMEERLLLVNNSGMNGTVFNNINSCEVLGAA